MKKLLFLLLFLPLVSIAQDAFSKNKAQQPAEDLTEVN
ncbi:MAG: hypothetical protein ACJAWA_001801, partial [Nonlabens sp.]